MCPIQCFGTYSDRITYKLITYEYRLNSLEVVLVLANTVWTDEDVLLRRCGKWFHWKLEFKFYQNYWRTNQRVGAK